MRAQLLAASAALILAACNGKGGHGGHPPPQFAAEVTRTSYGVAHVQAEDFAGVGYGLAYAFSEDNVCMLADSLLTVRGERSRYFGPDARATKPVNGEYGAALDFMDLRNEDSDFFFKGYLDIERLRDSYAAGSAEVQLLLRGYAAGYNRYLREHANDLPQACRGAAWVKPIGADDVMLLIAEKALHATGEVFASEIVAAARDADDVPLALHAGPAAAPQADAAYAVRSQRAMASNALAVGKEASSNGRGILLGNPHYPWTSTDRFYQLHITVPGSYDAMGVSLGGLPLVVVGFNKDLAWTHTVTKAVHFTTFRLPRDMADPMRYTIDGVAHQLDTRTAAIEVLQPDGSLRQKRKTFYFSLLGAVMAVPGQPQGPGALLVLGDPNRNNTRLMEQWLAIGRSTSVQDLKRQLDRILGLPWVNTVAADREGGALYADASVVPHVTAEQFSGSCLLLAPLLLFDGGRSACAWGRDGDGTPDGIFGSANAPAMQRADYVANSNDGYWLTNARQPLVGPPPSGYPPLYGPAGVPQHLRTRSGFIGIEDMLARRGRVGPDDVQALLFANRVLAAELVLPELLPACMASGDGLLAAACTALANWDRKADLDSRGAVLFREFWNTVALLPNQWALPFDVRDPLHTPRGVAPAAMPGMLAALKEAAQRLQQLGVPFDGRLGDYQVEPRNGQRFPIHGAVGDIDGSYNSIHMAGPLGVRGYEGVAWGTSYIHLVSFSEEGPLARGLLVYGQSTDPRNAHYADQLPLYAEKRLPLLPFTQAAIAADPARHTRRLREP